MAAKIRVGIIGASADRGWAAGAHLPALAAMPDYEVRALSSRTMESARKAGAKYGVETVFDNFQALVEHPEVDLVVVAVKVTDHYAPVIAALNAGKMVFCEWPLGRNLAEAQEMAALAQTMKARTVIGLQVRFSPQVRYLKELVDSGRLGKILGTSMVGSGNAWGGQVEPFYEYLMENDNGATLLSIPSGHALEAIRFALAEFESLTSTFAQVRGHALRTTDQVPIPMNTPDQLAISGRLHGGALASVYYRGSNAHPPAFLWEINGTEGDAVISVDYGQIQAGRATLQGAFKGDAGLKDMPLPAGTRLAPPSVPGGAPENVGGLYAQFAKDISDGTKRTPDFGYAIGHHKLIDAIAEADH